MSRSFLIAVFAALFTAHIANGHETTAYSAGVALDERLGHTIPADLKFRDENGKAVNLRDLIDKPTIIAPVYLRCTHTCPLLLTGLAEVLGKIKIVRPGRDFRIVTLSFNERETPALAREKKRDYLKAIGKPFPEDAWTFLTGDATNIKKFTDSIGFTFQRDGDDFSHPVAVIVIAPGGKVVRYLYGTSFLPFDITMAVTEAARGKVGSTAGRVLMYCFSYDPLKKSYVFNILKLVGTVVVAFVVSFFIYLIVATKKKQKTV